VNRKKLILKALDGGRTTAGGRGLVGLAPA